ncbi:MAG: hypothetical protein WC637_11955 [Victivallales bacterium]
MKCSKLGLSLLVGAITVMAGCSTTNTLKHSAAIPIVSETVVATPKVVAGERIQGKSSITNILFGLIVTGDSKYADNVRFIAEVQGYQEGFFAGLTSLFSVDLSKAKATAAYNACKSSGADIIFSPSYDIEQHNYMLWRTVNTEVTGFKGVIVGIEKIQCKDYLEQNLLGAQRIAK